MKRWVLPLKSPAGLENTLREFHPIERDILFNRGISSSADAEILLGWEYPQQAYDPSNLSGVGEAVERLGTAIEQKEKIIVYGDYDADGITGTALLVDILRQAGAEVGHYIPNRFSEGYGLNTEALHEIRDRGARVVVTVDCGIRALEEVSFANDLGLDVIVTDHHQPGKVLPPARAIINPNQAGDRYPFKDLAGVGVAYKLAQALMISLGQSEWKDGIDLVAIGTVADLVPLVGENRYLVQRGLDQLNRSQRKGLIALVSTTGHEFGRLDASSIGFGIAPRLNAAGRLDTAEIALQLLLAKDEIEAQSLSNELDRINRERQRVMHEVVEDVRSQIAFDESSSFFLLALDPKYNEGVIGLAASRIVDEFYRPTVVATYSQDLIKGSARSIPEFHITQALDQCAELLERYGGHAAAAGFSIQEKHLPVFREKLDQIAARELSDLQLRPTLTIDAVVELSELNWPIHEFIRRLEPCGFGNPKPVFAVEDASVVKHRTVGAEGRHLKLTLRDERKTFDAIAFRQGHMAQSLPNRVDIAFRLERSDYWGIPTLELNILDIRATGSLSNPQLTERKEST